MQQRKRQISSSSTSTAAASPKRRAASDARSDRDTNSWWVENADCAICLQKIQTRGVPRECRVHTYCYTCILEWVKITPRCPLCNTLLTRILKCTSAKQVLDADWSGVPLIKLSEALKSALSDGERMFYEECEEDDEDGSFCSDDAEETDEADYIIDSDAVTEDDDDDDASNHHVVSYWDENLSREPTFTGRRQSDEDEDYGDDDDDEETYSDEEEAIAFSLRPGEEHRPHRVHAESDADDDFVPSEDAPPARSSTRRRRKVA